MSTLAKWIRKAASLLSEPDRPDPRAEDFELEHVVFYHGLVGSTPESSRAYKDVRADFQSAVNRQNSQSMAICLKLPPLNWEDRLKKIADETAEKNRAALIDTLLPVRDAHAAAESSEPLFHEDWHVRANIALLLAHLKVTEAVPRLTASLNDTVDSIKKHGSIEAAHKTIPAFLHITRALASLQAEKDKEEEEEEVGLEAILRYTTVDEPWLKVDVVNALAQWPIVEAHGKLSKAGQGIKTVFSRHHKFFDYQTLALARKHKPKDLLAAAASADKDDTKTLQALALETVLGLVDIMESTFAGNAHMASELGLPSALASINRLDLNDAVALRAMLQLTGWLDKNGELTEEDEVSYKKLASQDKIAEYMPALLQQLQALSEQNKDGIKNTDSNQNPDSIKRARSADRHLIKLIGELAINYDCAKWQKELSNTLSKIFESNSAYVNETAEALGRVGNIEAVPLLIKKAKSLVSLEARTGLPYSTNPINEKDPAAAESYWFILKALGNLGSADALAFLLQAADDVAPDKREAAIASAATLYKKTSGQLAKCNEVRVQLVKSLIDPSMQVKMCAAKFCADLNLEESIVNLAKLTTASETSLVRQALDSLKQLTESGQKEKCLSALNDVLKSEKNIAKSKRIQDFIEKHLK